MSMLNNIQRQLQVTNAQAADVYPLTNRPHSLKAISHRPDLAHRVHILTQAGGSTDDELGAFLDYATVFKVYPWVRKAITVIANSVAPLPMWVKDDKGEAQLNHPVSMMLASGNDQQSPNELWEKWVVHMFLGGESFLEIVDDQRGRPLEFWARRPDVVGLLPDESPERLLYPRAAGYIYGDSKDPVAPENMWHSKFYNPLNQWRGLAPITALRQGIAIDMFAQAWSKKFLKDGARPDYAVQTPEPLTPSEKEEIESALTAKFSGPDNWHKPIILTDGAEIKTFSWAPKDIEWLEQRRFSRDEVGAVFGVPDEIMGYGRDTYENFETALKVLWVLTIAPLVQRRDVGLNHFFTKVRPLLRPGERVVTDFSGVGVLQEDLVPKLEQAGKFFAMGVPFDVIDNRLNLGIGSIPGGNTGYLPLNLLPVGTDRTEPQSQQNAADGVKKKNHEPIEYNSPRHRALYKQFEARLTEKERPFQRELKRQFQRQQNEVLRAVRQRSVSGEVTKAQIDIPSAKELFNLRVWNSEFTELFFPFFQNTVEGFGQNAVDDLGLGIDFNLVDPFVSAAIKDITIVFANDINTTTQDRIADVLTVILDEATQNGLSVPQVQSLIYDRISDVFNVRKSDYETERIARTELAEAANLSAILAGRQAQAVGVTVKKAWLAALDDRTRDSHAAAHRRYQRDPIGLEEDFSVGSCKGVAPGNTGCKEEDIFCRCSMQLIPV